MDKLLALACFGMGIITIVTTYPDGNAAVLLTLIFSSLIVFIIQLYAPVDKNFLIRIFLTALLARLAFGLFLHTFELRVFFGGDANTYDLYGNVLQENWFGKATNDVYQTELDFRTSGVGWGMLYLVAGIYSFTGRNILAAQSFCAVVGAAIAPLLFVCSQKIFSNRRVGQVSAILAAFLPAFIIWTGQLLKDGLLIFLIVLVMLAIYELQRRFSYQFLTLLLASLFGIISLRFYIFFMIAAAVVGSFFVGLKGSSQSIIARLLILICVGFGLTYLGVFRYASTSLETFGSLEKIQNSRQGLNSAESGFAEDIDVSTTEGAISAVPIGLMYLFLAPFPWELANLRQAITFPDIIIWYGTIPFLMLGLIYTIRHKLRPALGILIFLLMLSLGYSLFQGNVGTAYRQRCQIQVFLFIFAGVGWTLFIEKRENKKLLLQSERRRIDERLQANRIVETS